jgi:predicted Zn-dependent protease
MARPISKAMKRIRSMRQARARVLSLPARLLSSRNLASACLLLGSLLLSFSLPAAGQQRRRARRAPAAPSTSAPVLAGTPSTAANQQSFDQLAAQADAAREGDRIDEAIGLYSKAVALNPQWGEGWWYLATLYYDREKYGEAAKAFKETANYQPRAGATWAMLGLCEFQLGRYDDALLHIKQGRELGIGNNAELTRVMRYHEGILSTLKGEFEKGQVTLGTLSFEGMNSEDLIISLGLAVLRRAMLPKQVDANYSDRPVIRRAGFAEHLNAQKNMSDAQREYELLARDYPKVPGVQYAYGRFLLATRDDDAALLAFQRELENSPKHALARLQIAYIKLKNKEGKEGLPLAEEAVKLYPRLPLGHYILGRLLLETGQAARAIDELELARRMVPDEPKIYFALWRAYTKVNRKEEADRAREAFTRFSQQSGEAAERGTVRGEAIPESNPETETPTP